MRQGYYWAREKGDDMWEVVHVSRGWVAVTGDEVPYREEHFEFIGGEIERPMTDDEIEAMEK